MFGFASRLLFATAMLAGAAARAGETPAEPACSLQGVQLGADIDFNASVKRVAPSAAAAKVSCQTVAHTDLTVDGMRFRFSRASLALASEDAAALPASLVKIERLDGAAPRLLGWAVVPDHLLEEGLQLAPQIVKKNGVLLMRITSRHRHVYSLAGEKFERVPAFEWRNALTVEPALAHIGRPLGIDLTRMDGRVALVRESANPPVGQSAYDESRIAEAQLDFVDGKLVVVQQKIVKRREGDDAVVDEAIFDADEIRTKAKNLPQGVEPCSLGGWSIDTDPKGLNVRAAPSASAKIVGVVPPPVVFTEKDNSEFGVGPLHAEFDIVGYRDGWFLIENATAPGAPYDAKYVKKPPHPFKGRGWVSANMVGAQQGNMGEMAGLLYRAPHADAEADPARDDTTTPYATESQPAHIRACTGQWGFVETKAGDRGWTKFLCSNQVTTCG